MDNKTINLICDKIKTLRELEKEQTFFNYGVRSINLDINKKEILKLQNEITILQNG